MKERHLLVIGSTYAHWWISGVLRNKKNQHVYLALCPKCKAPSLRTKASMEYTVGCMKCAKRQSQLRWGSRTQEGAHP